MFMSAMISSMVRPLASSTPTWRLRDCGLLQVASRSPRPERPAKVSGRPPMATPRRVSSASERVTISARVFSPTPKPAAMPAAMANTFLSGPAISAPVTSVEV
jgi:hypothetical protein